MKKIPLDLESVTFLLQSLRLVQAERSLKISKHIIDKHVPELSAYSLSQLSEEELRDSLGLFRET